MNNLKHTPGPWINFSRMVNTEKRLICDCMTPDNGELIEEDVANAQLIAVAPEMLECLMLQYRIAKMQPQDLNVMESIKPIIEKATGITIDEVLKK